MRRSVKSLRLRTKVSPSPRNEVVILSGEVVVIFGGRPVGRVRTGKTLIRSAHLVTQTVKGITPRCVSLPHRHWHENETQN